jgi:hypothetical protein
MSLQFCCGKAKYKIRDKKKKKQKLTRRTMKGSINWRTMVLLIAGFVG